jgi:hypothetical protein
MAFQIPARCHHQTGNARPDFLRLDYCQFRFRHWFFATFFRQQRHQSRTTDALGNQNRDFYGYHRRKPVIDALTVTGKFIARPIKSFNFELVKEFDEKMKQYVKTNFAVEDPNALLAERLSDGSPGLVGVIFDKESSVKDVTSEMNILGWNMPRLFTIMVISQNIIKFGGLFLAIAGLFFLIGLKLAAPVLSAFGFGEKFANQIFYPFCWGVSTFSLCFPIVKEVSLCRLRNRAHRAFNLQRRICFYA